MRPCVVRAYSDAARRTPLNGEEQAVIAARPTRINSHNSAVVLSGLLILQNELAALVRIRSRRTRIVIHSVYRTRTSRNVDRRIERLHRPEVDGVIP